MQTQWFVIVIAVVAGWLVQMWLTYRQAMAFNRATKPLRHVGTLSVGADGKRYRGGRAYVAIAIDEDGVVRSALTLSGWTTFARARPLPAVIGRRVNVLKGDRKIEGLTRQQRGAVRQAAEIFTSKASVATTV